MDTVFYDSDCGICNRVKNTVQALDWMNTMRWVPNHHDEAALSGIPREHLDHEVYIVSGSRRDGGFAAVQRIAAKLPVVWMVAAYVIAKNPWTALLFAFLLSPLAAPAGQPVYDFVARNRYRLPGSTCDNQIK